MSCCRSIISSRELPKSDGVTMAFLACVISSTVGLRRPWGQRRAQCSCGLRGLLVCVPPRCPPGSPLQQHSSGSARAKIRRAQLIHLKRSTEAAACWQEAALESLRCFCRDLYVVNNSSSTGSEAAQLCWCGRGRRRAQPVPGPWRGWQRARVHQPWHQANTWPQNS